MKLPGPVALLSDGCGYLVSLPSPSLCGDVLRGKRRKNILHAVVEQADLTIKRADSAFRAKSGQRPGDTQ